MGKDRTRIVIIGAGFGGLEAAFSLSELLGNSARITLLDRSGRHSFVPSIHEIISGRKSPRDISISINAVLPSSVEFVTAEVERVDPDGRVVEIPGRTIAFDYLVIACGSENNFFDVKGADENAYRFRTASDAEKIRTDLVRLLCRREDRSNIIVAGGGPEGVEVSGELVDAVTESDKLSGERVTIELVESGERLLSGLPREAHEIATGHLGSIGVGIRFGERITEIRETTVMLGSVTELPASLIIWTGGVKPPKLINDFNLPKDPAGWLEVSEFLNCNSHKYIFGIGDTVSIRRAGEYVKPARLAYHAIDQAIIAALNINNLISGRRPVAYQPKRKPQLISIGKDMGIFVKGQTVRQGAWVVSLKRAVEARHLLSYLSRPIYSPVMRNIPFNGTLKLLRTVLPF